MKLQIYNGRMKRLVIILSIFLISLASLCAKSWFVCAGSFAKYDNAEERCSILNDAGYDCFIETARKSDGTKLFRVLFLDDVLFRDDARAKKDQLVKTDFFVKKGWTDLWICEADMPAEGSKNVFKTGKAPAKETAPVVKTPAPVIEVPAVSDKSVKADVPEIITPIIIPKYDLDEKEAENKADTLISCIAQLPISLEFQVSNMKTCDFDNTRKYPSIFVLDECFEDFADYDEISVGVYASYEDEESGAVIECLVLQANSEFSEDFVQYELGPYTDDVNAEVSSYEVPYGKMTGYYSEEGGVVYLCGISEDNKLVMFVTSEDLTKDGLADFVNSSYLF